MVNSQKPSFNRNAHHWTWNGAKKQLNLFSGII